eukprot:3712825-Lingulodinium_polyedra.AAC.1
MHERPRMGKRTPYTELRLRTRAETQVIPQPRVEEWRAASGVHKGHIPRRVAVRGGLQHALKTTSGNKGRSRTW